MVDPAGKFSWAEPDESMHTFVNELERSVGTSLYGRRMYGVMVAWESLGGFGDQPTVRERQSRGALTPLRSRA